MRSVNVKFHVVADALAVTRFHADQVVLAFRTANIDLNLIEGPPIAKDPAKTFSYDKLVAEYAANDRHFGHLVIGLKPDFHPNIAGELRDTATRGVAIVYTKSFYILQNHDLGLLQTAVHELGHMLNLGHSSVALTYDSVMNQAGHRQMDVAEAWTCAGLEAAKERNAGRPDFFLPPAMPLHSYPFAYSARAELDKLAETCFQPWGSKFQHLADGPDDLCRKLSCRFSARH